MKVFALICLAFVAVHAKKELVIKNTCDRPLVRVSGISDVHGGDVDVHSAITVSMDTAADTRGSDPFDMVATVYIKKWMFGGYVQLPQFMADKLAGEIVKLFGSNHVQYLKRNQYRIKCPFKQLLGHCFPQKGHSKVTIKLAGLVGLLPKQAAGWIKVEMKAKAPRVPVTKAFCLAMEMKLKV